ncbi:MAG: dephospho-CoA kinase [Hyphomicrobiaceae bacterium]|nr:dephospho-CoA kinase [Hyphomicrobiaceae bacterium]
MILLGLTGSIGTGKSTTSALFAARGVPVHDADATVHALYRGPAVPLIAAEFPGTVIDGIVDRTRLGAAVLGDALALQRLEAVIHPLVRQAELSFRARIAASAHRLAVIDVPLLFETGGDLRVDATVVVTCDAVTQRARVLSRPGMTVEKFENIKAKQMPDADKRRRAHFLVDSGHGFDSAGRQVDAILRACAGMLR